MKSYTASNLSVAALASLLLSTASACNPWNNTDNCVATNPALGTTLNVDFTKGASSDFSTTGGPVSYGSNGALLSVTGSGIAPTLISNWYIMFGRFEVVMQVAPGNGLVSSAILQSDDLDEIDWEILGSTPTIAQTNYFGKGLTTTYDREVDVTAMNNPPTFHTYVIDWNADRCIWSVDGVVERTLTPATANPGQYPQTPMQVKIGPWAGGDPGSNAPGTITWATANTNIETDFHQGPFNMYVKSVNVVDYSTGTDYSYGGAAFKTNGNWQAVNAMGGAVGAHAVAGSSPSGSSGSSASTPASSAAASNQSSTALASSSATRYTNTTTTKASSTNAAVASSISSLKSAVAASASADTVNPAAGAQAAITATTLITTKQADPTNPSSTITKVVQPTNAPASAASATTKAAASATTTGVTLQTGNSAARLGMGDAAALLGLAAGVVAYVL